MPAVKNPNRTPEYFAQITDPVRYVDACLEKIAGWREYCTSRGLADLWQTKLSNYYGMSEDSYSSQRVISGGTEGELSNIKINDLHKLVQDQLVVITAQRPAGIAKAVNTDVESLKNSRIGTALAEYYMTQAGLEQKFVNACEIALLVDEAFLELSWNKDAGEDVRPDVDPETGQPDPKAKTIKSGDANMRIHCSWNVARDPDAQVSDQRWHIISMLTNRFDLIAMYPQFKEQILAAAQDEVPQLKMQERKGEDNVYLHVVIHDRTPAIPDGRYSFIVGRTLVGNMDLPFPDYPVDRMSPSDVIDGATGYCPSNDVMAAEQVTDALHSIVTTNNITFGGQSLAGPPLTGVNVTEVAKGLRYFEMAPDLIEKLVALQFTKSAPETYTYIDKLSAKKQEMLGSVAGTIQAQAAQGASGSAMALVQAQAVQFNSGTQRSYYRTLSSVMTKLVGVLRVYADTPRVARIVGKLKSQGLKEFKFTGKDLNSISSIVYEMVNPVAQTLGGRMQMAQDLISNGQITSARQYLTLVDTGNLDALTAPDEEMNLLILEENEILAAGEEIQVIVTENHADHIKGHMSVGCSPQAKKDSRIQKAKLDHIQQHINAWMDLSQNNPALLLATGQQPLPVGPGGPMGGPPGGPPPGGAPGPGGPPPGAPTTPNGPLEANQPKQPNMPINPATGQPAQVPGAPAA
jgi:hypothetical protein